MTEEKPKPGKVKAAVKFTGYIGLCVLFVQATMNGAGHMRYWDDVPEMSDEEIAQARERDEITRLTTGEIALAQKVFGDHIDYENVYVRNSKSFFCRTNSRAAFVASDGLIPMGKRSLTIQFCDSTMQNDFSQTDSMDSKKVFIHEMAHIWQTQKNVNNHCNNYYFELGPNSKWQDFCDEQQGEIAKSYAYHFVLNPPAYETAYKQKLKQVIETAFPKNTPQLATPSLVS